MSLSRVYVFKATKIKHIEIKNINCKKNEQFAKNTLKPSRYIEI